MKKCHIGQNWFLASDEIAESIEIETQKTIDILEKLGYTVEIEDANYRSFTVGVIWIHFTPSTREISTGNEDGTLGFHINPSNHELISTFLTLHISFNVQIRHKAIDLFGDDSFNSNACDGNLLEPIRFLQKQRLRLLLNQ